MRLPLPISIASRDGSSNKDERMVNCLGEKDVDQVYGSVRPGLAAGAATATTTNGQGVVNWNGTMFAIYSAKYYLPSGAVMGSGVALPNASSTLMFDFTQSTT